jgi:hypothetical protein
MSFGQKKASQWTPTIEFPDIRVSHSVSNLHHPDYTACGKRVPRGYAIRSTTPRRPDCRQCERALRNPT